MSNFLTIRRLELGDETAFFEGLKAWDGESPTWHSFEWKPDRTYKKIYERTILSETTFDTQAGFVPSTMFYGFCDGKIIGRVNVRHYLNENLLQRGGHIGYAVAPAFRNRGFATKLFQFGLSFLKQINKNRVLVSCSESNLASRKMIEKAGGKLENIVPSNNGEMACRYWIDL